MRRHTISIKHALEGIVWALRTQPNYRVHFAVSLIVILLAIFFHISYLEYIVLILLIGFGFVIETINTAIEATTDAIDVKWRDDIKIAKDVAAGAMLLFSFLAMGIAALVFVPRIIALFIR